MSDLISRVDQHLKDQHPLPKGEHWTGDDPDALGMLVKCYGPDNVYAWHRVTDLTPHLLDPAKLAQHPPPVGRWCIVSQDRLCGYGAGIPLGYFLDMIPF
jgi:hypothetical protein